MFENLRKRFQSILSGKENVIKVDEFEQEITEILLSSDVSLETADAIVELMRQRLSGIKKVEMNNFRMALRDSMAEIINAAGNAPELLNQPKKPYVILFLGINGTGKTTTIAKVANYMKLHGKRIVIAASDTFRAGAIEQISILAERVGVPIIKHAQGSDPSSVAFDAIDHGRARNLDYVLIDSAGRMQTNRNLMEEMKKIKRVSKPDLTILVLDAMIGQDAISQAESFFKEVGYDAIILTKMDTDARGGAIFSILHQLRKPVMFIGTGQGLDDMIKFDPEWYLSRILPE